MQYVRVLASAMDDSTFDPYRKWLGIPPEEQPPHHYRLLGVGLFESDPDVIANAADARMVHLKTFQSGEHSQLSQRLLNEVSLAQVCLLNPAKKALYDGKLQQQLQSGGLGEAKSRLQPPRQPPPIPPPPQPPPEPPLLPEPPLPPSPGVLLETGIESSPLSSYISRRKRRRWLVRLLGAAFVLGITVLLSVVFFLLSRPQP